MSGQSPDPPPSGVSRDLDASLARVLSAADDIVGCGFLIGPTHLVTCAHVVTAALRQNVSYIPAEQDLVNVDFPLLGPGVMITARVVAWCPVNRDDTGDIAVLVIDDPPDGTQPVRLVGAEDFWGHPFRCFGFPLSRNYGLWVSGVLRARQSIGWVQMEGAASGHAIEGGFSGGAVWDDALAGVVGMTVAAEKGSGIRTAYLIPASELMRVWPPLATRTLPPCPYRGLSPFRETDEAVFFGREDVIERLNKEVVHRSVVALIGPSGSGKSSVLFAGLLPGATNRGWITAALRPAQSRTPILSLAGALIELLEPTLSETARIEAISSLATLITDGHLPEIVDRALELSGAPRLLLAVDQFEELLVRDRAEAMRFVEVILAALRASQVATNLNLTVVVTLRADFLNTALQIPALADVLEDSVIAIGHMSRARLQTVIENPLPSGVRYEVGLVDRILDDVGEGTGSLPLLEFALTLLWEGQDHGVLTHAAYNEIGGVDGALAAYAEKVFNEQLLPADQDQARRLFVQLARPSDIGVPVRRIARPPELGDERWQLAQRLAATRLLVTDRDPTGSDSVELVHEALISEWGRLTAWIDEDRAFRAWQEQLRASLAGWEQSHQDSGALLRGAPLAEAEKWVADRSEDIAEAESRYVGLSVSWRGRSLRRLTAAVVALALLLLSAISLSVAVVVQRRNNENQRMTAGSRHLASQVESVVMSDTRAGMLLALSAYRMSRTPEAIRALTRVASASGQVDTLIRPVVPGEAQDLRFSPTNPNLLAVSGPNYAALLDVRDPATTFVQKFDELPTSVEFSGDGTTVIVETTGAGGRSSFYAWSVEDKQLNALPDVDAQREYEPGSDISVNFDGKMIAVCSKDQIRFWRTSTQKVIFRDKFGSAEGGGCNAGFTARDELVYLRRDQLIIREAETGEIALKRSVPTSRNSRGSDCGKAPPSLSVDQQGLTGAVTDASGHVWWWDLTRKEGPLVKMKNREDTYCPGFEQLRFSGDGKVALMQDFPGFALQSVPDDDLIGAFGLPVFSNSYTDRGISLNANGTTLASPIGETGNAIALLGSRPAIPMNAYQIAVAPDNAHVVVGLGSSGVKFYTLEAQSTRFRAAGRVDLPRDAVEDLEILSPTGGHVAMVRPGSRKDVDLYSLTRGQSPLPGVLRGNTGSVRALAFSSSGSFLASASASQLTLWSVGDGLERATLDLPTTDPVASLAVSDDGAFVAAVAAGGQAWFWRVSDRERFTLTERDALGLAFGHAGAMIAVTTSHDVELWDLASITRVRDLPLNADGGTVMFGPEDRYLLTSAQAGEMSFLDKWMLPTFQYVGSLNDSGPVVLLPGTDDVLVNTHGGVRRVSFDPDEAAQFICHVTRDDNLTEAEWTRFGAGFEPVAACS